MPGGMRTFTLDIKYRDSDPATADKLWAEAGSHTPHYLQQPSSEGKRKLNPATSPICRLRWGFHPVTADKLWVEAGSKLSRISTKFVILLFQYIYFSTHFFFTSNRTVIEMETSLILSKHRNADNYLVAEVFWHRSTFLLLDLNVLHIPARITLM